MTSADTAALDTWSGEGGAQLGRFATGGLVGPPPRPYASVQRVARYLYRITVYDARDVPVTADSGWYAVGRRYATWKAHRKLAHYLTRQAWVSERWKVESHD